METGAEHSDKDPETQTRTTIKNDETEEENDVNDVIKNLETSNLEADRETTSHDSEERTSIASADSGSGSANSGAASEISGTASFSRSSSTTSSQKELVTANGTAQLVAKATGGGKSKDTNPSPVVQKSKIKNPFSIFKKKSSKGKATNDEQKQLDKMLAAVKIDTLPQLFVTKYLGFKITRGLYGIKYTREPLRELLSEVGATEKPADLPLIQLHISVRGIHVTEHKQNAVKSISIDSGLIPIEFISYGVQDVNYTRIFTFIIVREMSSRARKLECHAYLCDSSITCRKLALSVALAFQQYAKTLDGKAHKFQVDLRPMSEIDHDLEQSGDGNKDENAVDDCDA